jgi:NADPH:quinone reductase-like Zn-dependent oxidoreductase
MKAVIHERFGVEAVDFRDVPVPTIGDDQVLVHVRASSVNPVEWYEVYAPPFIRLVGGGMRRPKDPRLGTDFAGVVESVGKDVKGIKTGEDVFGTAAGSWAEYATASSQRIAPKPASVSFEEAAALPIAALTALQALRDVGKVEEGQKVLVNGASGGVGTYAVQIAKALGADVTAVCSTGNVEQAKSLGADRVVDYTKEDFTRSSVRHNVMIDIAGSRSYLRFRRVLTEDAIVVVVGAKMSASFLGPLKHIAGTKLQSIGRGQKVKFFVAKVGTDDLNHLAEMMQSGRLRSVIDRRFGLGDATEALRYLGQGHARGKIVIEI